MDGNSAVLEPPPPPVTIGGGIKNRQGEAGMAKILWIASYPKSGNTWIRFLVANLLYGRITESAKVEELIPDIHKGFDVDRLSSDHTTFVKTHWKYHEKLPLREDTVGAIYIVRHPLQVMVSSFNYMLTNSEEQKDGLPAKDMEQERADYINTFIKYGGKPVWTQMDMGSWFENVGSWLSSNVPFPVFSVRYEDMLKDPAQFVTNLCGFMGQEKTPDEIEAAITASSFESLRAMEEKEIAGDKQGFFLSENRQLTRDQGWHFMNEGNVDSYRQVLTPQQIEAARARFKPLMERLGYGA